MKRLPFQVPTTFYQETIREIDEEICKLIKKRKEISDKDSGFPHLEYISEWSKKFDVTEEFLKEIFKVLYHENIYKPIVEPQGFKKHVPVFKSIMVGNRIFTLTFIKQYENASVLVLNIDWNGENGSINNKHTYFELFIETQYECRMDSGCGGEDYSSHSFVVSPPLPDDLSGIDLIFTEREYGSSENSIEDKILIHLD
ncbi:chorismate mutase [Clostridium sp. C8-1-8]|uniref:chorismate mutase n=1 Tax=Clostridium sp. C8-1-8 TaxID=2698831 RepID=UPI00136A04AA|nr:chorismate mutase [Clostridium sp. C8-1-8]